MIKYFMDYYETCDTVRRIQIVWSDQKNSPPPEWLDHYAKDKYVFEMHNTDSLSNRFRVLDNVPTEVSTIIVYYCDHVCMLWTHIFLHENRPCCRSTTISLFHARILPAPCKCGIPTRGNKLLYVLIPIVILTLQDNDNRLSYCTYELGHWWDFRPACTYSTSSLDRLGI